MAKNIVPTCQITSPSSRRLHLASSTAVDTHCPLHKNDCFHVAGRTCLQQWQRERHRHCKEPSIKWGLMAIFTEMTNLLKINGQKKKQCLAESNDLIMNTRCHLSWLFAGSNVYHHSQDLSTSKSRSIHSNPTHVYQKKFLLTDIAQLLPRIFPSPWGKNQPFKTFSSLPPPQWRPQDPPFVVPFLEPRTLKIHVEKKRLQINVDPYSMALPACPLALVNTEDAYRIGVVTVAWLMATSEGACRRE